MIDDRLTIETPNHNKENHRLVCHTCGFKYSVGVDAVIPRCCRKPDVHYHDLRYPCGFCQEKAD